MKYLKIVFTMFVFSLLTACGAKVEVGPAEVGKIQGQHGFQEGVKYTSKFRLDPCLTYCDRIILLDVSDQRFVEKFKTLMPKDDLYLEYEVSMTLSVNSDMYDFIFTNVPAHIYDEDTSRIDLLNVYNRYASAKLQTIIPSIMAEFSIGEIASNRDKVNEIITNKLRQELKDTPFVVRHVGLTQVNYPSIITEAKEKAAERREQYEQMIAQRNLDLTQIQTEKEVEQQRREVELMKAATKALIAKEMMTKEYETLLKYETLQELAKSTNKVIVPTEMLDGLAVQNEVK